MSTASITNNSHDKKKRAGRNAIVLQPVKKYRLSLPVDHTNAGADFSIDEEDYITVRQILVPLGWTNEKIDQRLRTCVGIQKDGEERRVHKISIPDDIKSLPTSIRRLQYLEDLNLAHTENLLTLPEEIGQLTSLTRLNLDESAIASLPQSIGQLKNLKYLHLASTKNLSILPEEIGMLSSLTRLDLNYSSITSLPESIGQLKNLKHLNLDESAIASLPQSIGQLKNLKHLLASTKNLSILPEAIGMLSSLTILDLNHSRITSLPESIGQLQNLKYLHLAHTYNLLTLREAIGMLSSLIRLDLNYSHITSLPQSIGQLQNLKHLNLANTVFLSNLPEEIGNLSQLMILGLRDSAMSKQIPQPIYELKTLMCLDLYGDSSYRYPATIPAPGDYEFLLKLTQQCRQLGSLGLCFVHRDLPTALWYILACNRYRSRIMFGISNEKCSVHRLSNPKMWPLLLWKAHRAFEMYHFPGYSQLLCERSLRKPDAIYQFLIDGRESFLGALFCRKTR